MVDYISNTQDVRELASSVIDAQFPDTEIQEEQRAAYSHIKTITHKNDWDSSDDEFYALQKIEAQLAKCYIQEHYGGAAYAAMYTAQMDKIDKELLEIKDNMDDATEDEGDTITRTEYKSWVLNPDVPYESKLDQSLRADTVGTFD